MRKIISKLLLLPLAFTMFECADVQIVPRETGNGLATPENDERTGSSMRAYSRNLFVLEIDARKYAPGEPLPALFEMQVAGTEGTISIDWGDGSIETVVLAPGEFGEGNILTHQYGEEQGYVIKISGDIGNIFRYGISNQEIGLNNIHLAGLSGLRFFSLNFTKSAPRIIDLSHNRLIEDVDLIDLGNVSGVVQPDIDIIIPVTHNINHIRLFGTNLTTQSVDQVIDRVYRSVVRSPRPGTFGLSLSWAQPDDSDDMVGPPSSRALDKLRVLRDAYAWTLYPDFDNN